MHTVCRKTREAFYKCLTFLEKFPYFNLHTHTHTGNKQATVKSTTEISTGNVKKKNKDKIKE